MVDSPPQSAAVLSRNDILAWPKADLHCHLDGSMRLSTLLELATEQGKLDLLPASTESELTEILKTIDASETLESYLSWFRYSIPVMQTAAALERIAFELAEDNATENVRYLEVRFAPILCTRENLSLEKVLEAVRAGLQRAEDKYPIIARIVVCGLRDRMESASLMQAEVAVKLRDKGVVAFDLAGGEAGNPPKHHLHAFYYARNNLLNLTVHAGESWGPDSIRQAVFYCGAHRIGHGITLGQDPELMQYFVDHQIPLELCPTSNVQTKVVESYEAHPIRTFVDAGVPVTVNTDNRLFSRTTVTDELLKVHTRCGVGAKDLREVALNGFRYAFLHWERKQGLLREVTLAMPMGPSSHSPVW
jgi:adenosine deaminase